MTQKVGRVLASEKRRGKKDSFLLAMLSLNALWSHPSCHSRCQFSFGHWSKSRQPSMQRVFFFSFSISQWCFLSPDDGAPDGWSAFGHPLNLWQYCGLWKRAHVGLSRCSQGAMNWQSFPEATPTQTTSLFMLWNILHVIRFEIVCNLYCTPCTSYVVYVSCNASASFFPILLC